MTTRLRIVEPFPNVEDREPGMMWPYQGGWWIILPNHPDIGTPGHPYELSWRTTDKASDGQEWQVTGTAPNLTVSPSIDVLRFVDGERKGSYWHGWITDGVMEP